MSTVRIKVCGLTREEDVALAAAVDIDAVGFVLWPGSPRAISASRAGVLGRGLPPWTTRIGVFVCPSVQEVVQAVRTAGLGAVQLHAVADPAPFVAEGLTVLWATSFDGSQPGPTAPPGTTLMLDAYDPDRHGGTGRVIDWDRAGRIARAERTVLAGGLTVANVAEALARVRPYGIDVSSGVESAPGIKSSDLLRRFVETARGVRFEVRSS